MIKNLKCASNAERFFAGLCIVAFLVCSFLLTTIIIKSLKSYMSKGYKQDVAYQIVRLYDMLDVARLTYLEDNSNNIEMVTFSGTSTPAKAVNTTLEELLPNYVAPPHMKINVVMHPQCILGNQGGNCVTEDIYVRHCKTNKERRVTRFNNGVILNQEYNVYQRCH